MQFRKAANNIAVMAGSVILLVTMFPLVVVVFLGFLSYALAKCEEEEGGEFLKSAMNGNQTIPKKEEQSEVFEYERIRKDVRECENFGKSFKCNSFLKPKTCRYEGYSDVCTMKGKCVFASHLCADRWHKKRAKRKPSKSDFLLEHGEAPDAVRPSPIRLGGFSNS